MSLLDSIGLKSILFVIWRPQKCVNILETTQQYKKIIEKSRRLFEQKTSDYGTAWRILRPSSLTDQIFIKAQRIRTIQETGEAKVDETVEDGFVGIINYCIMALIQLEMPLVLGSDLERAHQMPVPEVMALYDRFSDESLALMERKNHDYGEAWRAMRVSSITDLILMKLLRTKQIEDNQGKTKVSEGVDANYFDMLNYAVFALILLGFDQE